MLNQNRLDLARHRLLTSKDDCETADEMIKIGKYKAATNRAYYSIFHAMRAVLALEAVDFKKHSAIISYFNKEYIRTEKFDKGFYDLINDSSIIRNNSDYDEFFIATKEEAEQQAANAKLFYNAVEAYINNYIIKEG